MNLPNDLTEQEFDVVLRKDLMTFIYRCFLELNPTLEFSNAPHLRIMAAKLADCLCGRGPKRLIINLPPRSLKSISVSVAAVAWILGLDPTKQIICASYGQALADKHALDTRTIMMSPFYQRLFPGTRLEPKKLAVSDFATTKHGFRMATSVGGVLTGRGGNVLILDDTMKPDDALSESKREAGNGWFDNTLLSRLNNKVDGIIIIIVMQRLHQDDLVGHVLEKGGEWDILSFPAIAEQDEEHTITTAFGTFTFHRKAGEVLDPSRESKQTLLEMKEMMGSYNFESQYQQNPTPIAGTMVLKAWIQRYDPSAPLPRFTTVLQSWDTANKCGELNDFSVCTTWGFYDGKYYLLDVFRARLNYPELKRKVIELSQRFNAHIILIEDKASGTQLIQDLKADGHLKVKSYVAPAQTDKVMRLHAQTALFESGKVFLPTSAGWLAEYERELTAFPGTKFDDQVDSTTQALDYFSQNRGLEIWSKLGRLERLHVRR